MQLVVPSCFQRVIWQLTHTNPTRGHMGQDKTTAQIARRVFWPGLGGDIARCCTVCPECQKARKDHPSRAPLCPMPVIDVLFARITMDIIGPLPCSSADNQYILVFMGYAMRYPDAVPLRTVMAPQIAEELVKWIT